MVVYFHRNPLTLEIFYVGIGNDKRPYSKKCRNNFWKNYVNKYGNPVIQIVYSNIDKKEACRLEVFYISLLGNKVNGGQLVNLSDGGETNIGYRLNAEQKKAVSERAKKRSNSHLFTKEARAKANLKTSASLKGRMKGVLNPNYGNKWTDEMKTALSEKQKQRWSKIPHTKKLYQKLSVSELKLAKEKAVKAMIESHGRKVFCTKSGLLFNTIVEAANSIGMKKDTLRMKLNGTNPNATSLIYAGSSV